MSGGLVKGVQVTLIDIEFKRYLEWKRKGKLKQAKINLIIVRETLEIFLKSSITINSQIITKSELIKMIDAEIKELK